jgi:phosphate acetyltransferase
MKPLDHIIETAKASPRRIVLAEGEDSRIIEGAIRATREGVAEIILVGNRSTIEVSLAAAGAIPEDFQIEDPISSELAPGLAKAYHVLRAG